MWRWLVTSYCHCTLHRQITPQRKTLPSAQWHVYWSSSCVQFDVVSHGLLTQGPARSQRTPVTQKHQTSVALSLHNSLNFSQDLTKYITNVKLSWLKYLQICKVSLDHFYYNTSEFIHECRVQYWQGKYVHPRQSGIVFKWLKLSAKFFYNWIAP